MSNWTTITSADLLAQRRTSLINTADTIETGPNDPIVECIADAVAKVRASVSNGHQIDANPAKVPNSLRGLTARLAIWILLPRIPSQLTEDDRRQQDADELHLRDILKNPSIQIETPDTPAGSAEMQTAQSVTVITSTPRWPWTRYGMEGLT